MADSPWVLRMLSYNVRSLRDDPAAVARVIRSAQAQVVCIQEAPRLLRWRSACAALARRSGLVVVTGGRTAAGNLIMCSLGVDVLGTSDQLLAREPRLHQRGVALARLRWRGAEFAVAGTHLDLDPAARLRHVEEIGTRLGRFAAQEHPSIVAGDFNDVPGSPVWKALGAARSDVFASVGEGSGYTFTAANPTRRIDAVFADPRFGAVAASVLDGVDVAVGSDHRPLLVSLALD